MKLHLKITMPDGITRSFEHAGSVVRVGRDPESELSFQGEDGHAVSWNHARIELSADLRRAHERQWQGADHIKSPGPGERDEWAGIDDDQSICNLSRARAAVKDRRPKWPPKSLDRCRRPCCASCLTMLRRRVTFRTD